MRKSAIVAVLLCLVAGSIGWAEEFDISRTLQPSFYDIALLPSRLTYYNQHDDAATASYTCCKPYQHKEIMDAIKANEVFLDTYPDSDLADDTLMHYGWVTSVRKDFRAQVAAYDLVLQRYPDSHMADDAAWHLGQLYARDKDHLAAIDTLNFLITRFPTSTWADDAHILLVQEFNEVDDELATIDTLQALADKHPTSDYCVKALCLLMRKYFSVEAYDEAIRVAEDLMRWYPVSDCADDAQMMIANSLRLQGKWLPAIEAYEYLIHNMYGSSHTNTAMREANNLRRRTNRSGRRIAGELYDPLAWNPGREAADLWDMAQHHENYRGYAQAIDLYRQFIREFPGHDNFDDAFFHIGECYRQMKILFEEVNKAKGPEDLFRLSDHYADATGGSQIASVADEAMAIQDASGAYATIINEFHGSPLRDDALYQIAIAYTPYEDPEEVSPDNAFTLQELLIHFPGSEYEFEALVKLIRFYADPQNYEISQQMYPQAAAAMPDLLPPGLIADKDTFLQLMKLYKRHTEHAWFEAHFHHIKYVITPPDMVQAAYYYQSALLMSQGKFKRAASLLEELVQARTGDFIAPATYLLARCYQQTGRSKQALAALKELETTYQQSGLADDAAWIKEEIDSGGPDSADYTERLADAFSVSGADLDTYVGQGVVVFAPYTVSPLMRQYNMPNIWEQAQQILADWCGIQQNEKTIIYVDPNGGQSAGNPMRVSAAGIKDPPNWMLGLGQLSHNAVRQAAGPQLADQSDIMRGLSQFAAASLQYELVTETRDAIGSASAVKLPQEAVLRSRDQALKALEEYVRAGEERQEQDLTGRVVAGMLYALLDAQGYTADQLIDREPYRQLFAQLRTMPAGSQGLPAFATALDRTFNGAARDQLLQWGMPLFGGYYQAWY